MANTFVRYRVYFTPLTRTGTYGSQVEVTDNIDASGVKSIKKSIDAGDYDIGLYRYDNITIKGLNQDGIFNDEQDSRSMFPAGRDLAKVEVHFIEVDPDNDGSEDNTVVFKGLINEEGTRSDPIKDEVRFKVLSLDSVIRNTKVSSGAVPNGALCSTAMETILNTSRITSVLNFSASNINPDLDFTIDDGTVFDNQNTNEVLNNLLLASNSVFVIDSSDNMIVKSRDESAVATINLYGPHDIHGRENIVKLSKYNNGKHRQFTSVIVNDSESSDTGIGADQGFRQKKITLDFITTAATASSIADRLLSEFKAAKIECEVEVDTGLVKDLNLLDRISLNYPLRIVPRPNTFLPVVGIAVIDNAVTATLPDTFGSLDISPNIAFKVIEKRDNVKDFTTTLKLRQKGTTPSDGVF